jgi:hypothetical protein
MSRYSTFLAEEEREAMDRQVSVVKEVAAASRQTWKRVGMLSYRKIRRRHAQSRRSQFRRRLIRLTVG